MKRARLIALWACAAVAAAGVGAIAWCAFYNLFWLGPGHTRVVMLDRGGIYFEVSRSAGPLLYSRAAEGMTIHSNSLYDLGHGRRWVLWPKVIDDPTVLIIRAPIWIPTVCAAVGAAWLWKPWRRRTQAGVCPKCSYDRRGLPADSKCPECGKV